MEGLEDLHLVDDEGVDLSDSSVDEMDSSASSEDDEPAITEGLSVTEDEIARNYELLGSSLPSDPPLHLLQDLKQKYPSAFSELSESTLATVLQENPLGFELSDFQVHIPASRTLLPSFIENNISGVRHQLPV